MSSCAHSSLYLRYVKNTGEGEEEEEGRRRRWWWWWWRGGHVHQASAVLESNLRHSETRRVKRLLMTTRDGDDDV